MASKDAALLHRPADSSAYHPAAYTDHALDPATCGNGYHGYNPPAPPPGGDPSASGTTRKLRLRSHASTTPPVYHFTDEQYDSEHGGRPQNIARKKKRRTGANISEDPSYHFIDEEQYDSEHDGSPQNNAQKTKRTGTNTSKPGAAKPQLGGLANRSVWQHQERRSLYVCTSCQPSLSQHMVSHLHICIWPTPLCAIPPPASLLTTRQSRSQESHRV
jgi:hypothetical protein